VDGAVHAAHASRTDLFEDAVLSEVCSHQRVVGHIWLLPVPKPCRCIGIGRITRRSKCQSWPEIITDRRFTRPFTTDFGGDGVFLRWNSLQRFLTCRTMFDVRRAGVPFRIVESARKPGARPESDGQFASRFMGSPFTQIPADPRGPQVPFGVASSRGSWPDTPPSFSSRDRQPRQPGRDLPPGWQAHRLGKF
jgi:hypothetical protein